MKDKHKRAYMQICEINASLSECLRENRHFGAVIVDPEENVMVASGYNGFIRGGSMHCGGDGVCTRIENNIPTGTHMEIGCIHAEENAITNAARQGVSTKGKWMFIDTEPCVMCARRMVQSGITRVVIKVGKYENNGVQILMDNNVGVEILEDK